MSDWKLEWKIEKDESVDFILKKDQHNIDITYSLKNFELDVYLDEIYDALNQESWEEGEYNMYFDCYVSYTDNKMMSFSQNTLSFMMIQEYPHESCNSFEIDVPMNPEIRQSLKAFFERFKELYDTDESAGKN